MTVFDIFVEKPYTFLEISKGEVYGNRVTKETEFMGVFKLRATSSTSNNIEFRQSNATLHAHPEDYDGWDTADLVGQGIAYDGINYEITNVTGGMNFDTGVMEHLTFTLERASYVAS